MTHETRKDETMKCPKCNDIFQLSAMVDLEQWDDTQQDNEPDATLYASAVVLCGECKHQGTASQFGLTKHITFGFKE